MYATWPLVLCMAKTRVTFLLSEELANEVRDAVVFLAGHPHRLTMASLAETALRKEVEELKRLHNQGQPFPAHVEKPRGGRPVGS